MGSDGGQVGQVGQVAQQRRPLDGVRVVDVTQEAAGPLTGRLLAEMGADVVHVEPLRGDNGRNTTTPFLGREGIFHQLGNRSKRGLAVDLSSAAGQEVLRRLAVRADVLINGTARGTLERLGLGYDELSALNDQLVYASLTGYGPEGPLGGTPGYDVVVQAFTGIMNRHEDGPRLTGFLYADTATPLVLVNGILLALMARPTIGRGQLVETSLLQGALHMLTNFMLWVEDDPILSRTAPSKGSTRGADPTTAVYGCADGSHLMLSAWNDAQFVKLCHALDVPHIAEDPNYRTRPQRAAAFTELTELFDGLLGHRTAAEWVEALAPLGIPCQVVAEGPRTIFDHPQLAANDMLVELQHPTKGRMRQPNYPVRLSETPAAVDGPAPLLGQHTDEVLAEVGYDAEDIARLRADGIVA
jgi:crotonobetainyl-CoA:carnitine CoA-transferase CaiB-like acyl-CoA transferase